MFVCQCKECSQLEGTNLNHCVCVSVCVRVCLAIIWSQDCPQKLHLTKPPLGTFGKLQFKKTFFFL